MSNMSYCRFQNTRLDLSDCRDALEGLFGGDEGKLSREELRAAKSLVEDCLAIVELVADQRSINLEDGGLDDFEKNYEAILDEANDAAGEEG